MSELEMINVLPHSKTAFKIVASHLNMFNVDIKRTAEHKWHKGTIDCMQGVRGLLNTARLHVATTQLCLYDCVRMK